MIRKLLIIFFSIILLILIASVFFFFRYKPASDLNWGLTFSYQEAKGLGFDPKVLYLDMINDLKPKNLRLMTYWDDSEKQRGKFDFQIVDEQLIEAQKQNINVVLVVGRK